MIECLLRKDRGGIYIALTYSSNSLHNIHPKQFVSDAKDYTLAIDSNDRFLLLLDVTFNHSMPLDWCECNISITETELPVSGDVFGDLSSWEYTQNENSLLWGQKEGDPKQIEFIKFWMQELQIVGIECLLDR